MIQRKKRLQQLKRKQLVWLISIKQDHTLKELLLRSLIKVLMMLNKNWKHQKNNLHLVKQINSVEQLLLLLRLNRRKMTLLNIIKKKQIESNSEAKKWFSNKLLILLMFIGTINKLPQKRKYLEDQLQVLVQLLYQLFVDFVFIYCKRCKKAMLKKLLRVRIKVML